MATFPSIRIEGGLLGPDLLDKIVAGELPGQKPADFGIEARRSLTDEIAAAFADARALWGVLQNRLQRLPEDDVATTVTRDAWAIPFLGLLGYTLSYNQRAHEVDGLTFAISHRTGEAEDSPPVHIVGARQELGRIPASGRPRMAPHSLVQEYLNRTEHVWGLVTNGRIVRLLRDSTMVRRQAYVEFDLAAMIEEQRFQDFAAFYRLLHWSRLPRGLADAGDCLLENYHAHSIEQGGRVREHLREGVEECIKTLANGFLSHSANGDLRRRASIAAGSPERVSPEDLYRQLLRLVYRFLFLLVSEDRGLLSRDPLYRDHYGMSRLRRLLGQRAAYTEHDDLWQSLRVLWYVLSSDAPQPALGGKPMASALGLEVLNGELFAPLDPLDAVTISNRELLTALWSLAWYREKASDPPRRVNYAALDVEELGSVYESLLEYHPAIDADGAGRPLFSLVFGSDRKTTGSYYTPPELVAELIKSALEPVIADRLAAAPKAKAAHEKALLSIRVCDPACGSGHFLLAAARRIGKELARVRTEADEPSPEAVREAIRDAISHCIYGVDKNPLAVDLCRVALWLEGHTPDKPLTFLDHRIRCGDSLIGVFDLDVLRAGIPDKAFEPLEGDDKATARAAAKRNREERDRPGLYQVDAVESIRRLGGHARQVGAIEDESPELIRRKRDAFNATRASPIAVALRKLCNLWTAAFFQPLVATPGAPLPITTGVLHDLAAAELGGRRAGSVTAQTITAEGLAAREQFFHWPLEFPDVLEDGGFHVVVGNPPWGAQVSDQAKRFIRATLASVRRGNLDTFAAFTHHDLAVTRPGGYVGLVLPDILLLKNYPDIRLHLLEHTAIKEIAHWGQAFRDASIDVCSLVARVGTPPPDHEITCVPNVQGGRPGTSLHHRIRQEVFLSNKDYRFNLQLSPETQSLIESMQALGPRVGDLFTIREGVHSGNVRDRLFLDHSDGEQCRPLIFGRDEIAPMRLVWAGKYIQLDPSRFDRDAGDYFNLGDPALYARPKVLVRRTGDFLLAAPDLEGRFCSNNFFILIPRESMPVHMLLYAAAALNSPVATLYFRTIQPRTGRLFAELKITHLEEIPIPFFRDALADEEGRRLMAASRSDEALQTVLDGFRDRLLVRIRNAAPRISHALEPVHA